MPHAPVEQVRRFSTCEVIMHDLCLEISLGASPLGTYR
jgi:hypothetical protein